MFNFKRNKLSIAVHMALALSAGFTLSGCDSGDTSTTSAVDTYERVSNARVAVVGVVQDSNGNPIYTEETDEQGVVTYKGVSVHVAGKTVETDPMTGAFRVDNVEVSNVTNQANAAPASAIPVVVQAPTKYLGATVTVNPFAQVESGNNAAGTNATNNLVLIDGMLASAGVIILPKLEATVTGFLRNLSTQAGLPIGTSVALDLITVGSTAVTEPGQGAAAGVAVSWSTGKYVGLTTDSNGKFTIQNVPSDSTFDLVVGGNWILDDNIDGAITGAAPENDQVAPGRVVTSSEVLSLALGNIFAQPMGTTDTVPPYVKSVPGTVTTRGVGVNFAVLNSNVDGSADHPIVLVFSEPVTDLGLMDKVLVKDVTNTSAVDIPILSAELSGDGTKLSITIDPDKYTISANTRFDVLLARESFTDKSSNLLGNSPLPAFDTDTDSDTINDAWSLAIDADADGDVDNDIDVVTGNNQYIRVSLSTYQMVDSGSGSLAWVDQGQILEDTLNSQTKLQMVSTAFADSDDTTAQIDHLNAWEDFNNDGRGDSAARIAALATAVNGTLGGGAITAADNVARIKFTANGAARYRIRVINNQGVPQTINNEAGSNVLVAYTTEGVDKTANPPTRTPDNNTLEFGINSSALTSQFPTDGSIEMVLSGAGVTIGGKVSITPVDGFGYEGTSISLTLKDLVEPTTILQRSYNAGANATISNVAGVVGSYGEGGELSGTNSADPRPKLAIGPQLLDNQGTTVGQSMGDNTLTQELSKYNGVPPGGTAYQWPTYDATAWANSSSIGTAANRSRTIGIAFSEDIQLDGTPTMDRFVAQTTGDTPWQVLNNATVREILGTEDIDGDGNLDVAEDINGNGLLDVGEDIDGDGNLDVAEDTNGNGLLDVENGPSISNADLIMMTVDDVFTLANTDGDTTLDSPRIIDFRGVVTDTAATPNPASEGSNAIVQVTDRMPPFVTKASYTGTAVEVTFNEKVKLAAAQTFVLGGATFTIATKADGSLNADLSADGMTVTLPIPSSGWSGIDTTNDRQLDRSAIFTTGKSYAEDAYGTTAGLHAFLNTRSVTDVSGVSWNMLGVNEALGQNIQFAAFDAIGPFAASATVTGFLTTSQALSVTYSFTHPPFNLDTDASGTIDAADFVGAFQFNGAAVNVDTATYDATANTLTVTYNRGTNFVVGNLFGPTAAARAGTFVSQYDNTEIMPVSEDTVVANGTLDAGEDTNNNGALDTYMTVRCAN
jgi:hypothetical protein